MKFRRHQAITPLAPCDSDFRGWQSTFLQGLHVRIPKCIGESGRPRVSGDTDAWAWGDWFQFIYWLFFLSCFTCLFVISSRAFVGCARRLVWQKKLFLTNQMDRFVNCNHFLRKMKKNDWDSQSQIHLIHLFLLLLFLNLRSPIYQRHLLLVFKTSVSVFIAF